MPKSSKKSAAKKTPITNSTSTSRYEKITIVVSIFSIIAAIVIGILTILNSNAIARLDREVYAPELQYFWGQNEQDSIFLEVANSGKTSAENVSIDIFYNLPYILENCKALAPFQDLQQVKPLQNQHITYRVPILPSSGAFILSCELYSPNAFIVLDKETQQVIPLIISDINDIKTWTYQSISLSDVIISVQVISGNSNPALEMAKSPTVSLRRATELTEDAYRRIYEEYTVLFDNMTILNMGTVNVTPSYPYPTPTP